jgi:hypothetical protein
MRTRQLAILRSWGVPDAGGSATVRAQRRNPLLELRLLQSLTTRRRPQTLLQLCGASHEVWSPTARSGSGSHEHIPGLPHPVRSAYRVPHPLDGLLSRDPPALFHAVSARGVVPFRAFPFLRAVVTLDTRNPLGVGDPGSSDSGFEGVYDRHAKPGRTEPSQPRKEPHRDARLQGLAPTRSPYPVGRGSAANGTDALLGFHPLQGLTLTRPGTGVSTRPPPMDFLALSSQPLRGAAGWP